MNTQTPSHVLKFRAEGEFLEFGIEHVKTMTTLVDGAIFGHYELLGGRVEGAFLEKVVDLVAGLEKVSIAHMGLFSTFIVRGGECGQRMVCEVKVGDELLGVIEEGDGVEKVGQEEVAIAMKLSDLFGGEDASFGS